MAYYISDREQRQIERERRKEEMERERDRLAREIEQRERSLQMRDMEDYRQELFRIRRERKEMKRQHEIDSKKYDEQRRKIEEIDRRKEEEERRRIEMKRRFNEERKKNEIERRKKYEDERRRLDEIEMERRFEEERKKLAIERRKKYEDERRRSDEIERRRLEEIEKKELDEIERKFEEVEKKRCEEKERRRPTEDRLMSERQNYERERRRLQEEIVKDRSRFDEEEIEEERRKFDKEDSEEERRIYEKEYRVMKDANDKRRVLEVERRSGDEDRNVDRYQKDQSQTRIDERHIPKETEGWKRGYDKEEDEVFEEESKVEDKKETVLRRQSETALQHLKRRNTSLERELKQLNKIWTPDTIMTLHPDIYNSTRREESSNEEKGREWTTVDKDYNQGYETDDEIERLGDDIEKLKIKEMKLLQEMEIRKNIKKEREERRRQETLVEKEREERRRQEAFIEKKREERRQQEVYKRREEKHRAIEQLKKEQLRLLEELRTHEDTLNALSDTESESEEETLPYRAKEEYIQKQPYLPRDRSNDIRSSEGQKYTLPRLPNLTEETFEEWKLEIEVMMDSRLYHQDALLHAVRNSLSRASKGIRSVLPTIDTKANTREILEKLENIYGDRRSGESHLADFYKAKQKSTENVAEWGIRLENILLKASKKEQVNKEQTDQMLRKRFWKHLYDETLKLSTRLFYETSKSFEELLKKVRIEENEMNDDSDSSRRSRKKETEKHSIHDNNSLMNELLDRVKHVEEEMECATGRSRGRERYRQGYRGRGSYRRYERDYSNWRGKPRHDPYEYEDSERIEWRNIDRDTSYGYRNRDQYRGRDNTRNRQYEEYYKPKDEFRENEKSDNQEYNRSDTSERNRNIQNENGNKHETYTKSENQKENQKDIRREEDRWENDRGRRYRYDRGNRRGGFRGHFRGNPLNQ